MTSAIRSALRRARSIEIALRRSLPAYRVPSERNDGIPLCGGRVAAPSAAIIAWRRWRRENRTSALRFTSGMQGAGALLPSGSLDLGNRGAGASARGRLGSVFESWAPWREVRLWFLLSAGIAALMLIAVACAAYLLPADPIQGSRSRLLGDYSRTWDLSFSAEVSWVFTRNAIVLALHYCCCLVGVIVSREHRPLPERWDRAPFNWFHRPLPKWAADLSLAYAMTATLASIALQSTELGFTLADISAYSEIAPWQFVVMILPHAIPELVAIFLPLGLFLIQSFRHELKPLQKRATQSLIIALPILVAASVIEVSLTPELIEWWIDQRR